MSSTQASTQIAKQYMEGALNKKNWGTAMYNVLVEGLIGDGVTNDTVALQTLVNTSIAAGRKAIFFPHGTYYVTALTNANQVIFLGDNASFVGGYTGEIIQLGEGGVTQAEFDALEAEVVTKNARYVVDYDPIYDLALNVLAATIYHELATFSIPTDKNWYVNYVSGINNSVGNGLLRAFSWDLTAGASATGDSVRGAIGVVKSSGPSNIKSVHGTALGLTGHTGVLVGVVGQAQPVATSSESYAFQATVGDGATAAMIINGVLNNGTEHVDFGIYNFNNALNFDVAFINYDAMGVADFLRMRNQAGSANLFRVNSAGDVLMGNQKSLSLNNTTRDFQIQAITSGDYVRILATAAGDIIKFKANQSTEFMGVAVLKNYLTGALPAVATFPNGIGTFGPSKLPIYCDGTNWRKISDDTIVT